MPDVFISYSTKDQTIADFVHRQFVAEGISIVNRGRTYAPPTSHPGMKINSEDVAAVADLALRFYEGLVDEAEKFFVK